jgi:hypothetical protein
VTQPTKATIARMSRTDRNGNQRFVYCIVLFV